MIKEKQGGEKITCFFSFILPKNAKKIKIFLNCVIVAYFYATFGAKRGIGERRFLKRTGFDDLQAKVQNRKNFSVGISQKIGK